MNNAGFNLPGFKIQQVVCLSFVPDFNFFDFIPLTDFVNNINILNYFAKNGVTAVEMCCIVAAVTDKKLRSAGIAPGMGHRQNTAVVILIAAIKLTLNLVTRSANTCAFRTASLNDKVRNYAVKG